MKSHMESHCGRARVTGATGPKEPGGSENMERITQRKSNDCGVACVAMIIQRYAGCPAPSSYDAANAVMFGLEPAGYTSTRDLRRGLRAFGIQIGPRRIRFTKVSSQDMGLTFDAIIGTKATANGNWHWLIWDAAARNLLDPNPKKKSNGHRSAYHYIEVLPP